MDPYQTSKSDEDKNDQNLLHIVDNDFLMSFLNDQPKNYYQNIQVPIPNYSVQLNQQYSDINQLSNQFIQDRTQSFVPKYTNPVQMDFTSQDYMNAQFLSFQQQQQQQQQQPQQLTQQQKNQILLQLQVPMGQQGIKQEQIDKDTQKSLTSIFPKSDNLTKDQEKLLLTNKNLFNYKNNLKNTYINKINTLMSDSQNLKKQEHPNIILKTESQPNEQQQTMIEFSESAEQDIKNSSMNLEDNKTNQVQKTKSYDEIVQIEEINDNKNLFNVNINGESQLNHKLARNRESARNSRKRKKIYIELLESKVAFLTEELEKKNRTLENNNQYLNKLSFQSQILNGFIFGRQQLFEKLEKSIQNNSDDNEVNLLLDSLRFRLGAAGKERITAINYFFKQILDICIPTHFRYLLQSSVESIIFDQDMFQEGDVKIDQENRSQWRDEFIKYMEIKPDQRAAIFKYKKKCIQEKQKLDELIGQLLNIKKQIQVKTHSIENICDDLRNILTPIQSAKFLLFLEKNKYRKDISNQYIWDSFLKENEQDFSEESETPQQQNGQQFNSNNINNYEQDMTRKKIRVKPEQ